MIDQKLITLKTLIEEKSYTKAANKLGLTQPAVSTHIKLLEQEFNITIFDKSKETITLTKEGKQLIRFALNIIDSYENFSNSLINEKNYEYKIGLDISYKDSYIFFSLAKYVFRTSKNKISNYLKLEFLHHNELIYKLKNNELDLIITFKDEQTIDFYEELISDNLILISSKNSKLAKHDSITLEMLKRYKIILPASNLIVRAVIEKAYYENNISKKEYNSILELNDTLEIQKLVEHGFACAILTPSSLSYELVKHLNVLTFTDLKSENNISILAKEKNNLITDITNYLSKSKEDFISNKN